MFCSSARNDVGTLNLEVKLQHFQLVNAHSRNIMRCSMCADGLLTKVPPFAVKCFKPGNKGIKFICECFKKNLPGWP